MTEQEAIEWQEAFKRTYNHTPKEVDEACDMAIKALEEIQEYRAIGTAGECRAAVEKIKPKKPAYEGDGYSAGKIVYDTWICPGCGKDYEMEYENYDYCPNCGQAIRWNNNLEEMEDE